MRIVFAGDCVIHNIKKYNCSKEVKNYIKQHDFRICNVEGAFKNSNSIKSDKCGSHVFNNKETGVFLKNIGFNVAALANNHIMDYGIDTLVKTKETLTKLGFHTVGAGKDYSEAYSPLILKKGQEEIAIINVGQAEFGVIKNQNCYGGGYAWINCPYIKEIIQCQKLLGRKVIIFAHCGLEEEIIPMPEWIYCYHELVEMTGMPLIATHPHTVQGYEEYKGQLICYSLGNFIFEHEDCSTEWNRSIIVSLDTLEGKYEIKRVSIKNGFLDFDEDEKFKKDIDNRCELLKDIRGVESRYDDLSEKYWNNIYNKYYSQLIECEKLYVVLKYVLKGIIKRLLRRKNSRNTLLLHNIQIETHRWMVERFLYKENRRKNSEI